MLNTEITLTKTLNPYRSTASVNPREILPWEGDVVRKVSNEDMLVFPCYQPVSNS